MPGTLPVVDRSKPMLEVSEEIQREENHSLVRGLERA